MHIQQGKHRQLTGYRTSSQPDMYCKCLNYVHCEGQLVVGSAHCSFLVHVVPLLQGSCTSLGCAVGALPACCSSGLGSPGMLLLSVSLGGCIYRFYPFPEV